MINIIPQSEVKLLRIPLEKDEEHTLSFNNVNEQTNYFLNNVFKSYSDFTYIREQQALVVPENYDTICTCTYLMYRNNGFNNKYFYAFITKMEYVSENSTRIYFEIDSLQTWFFQLEMNQVFIEREHVSDDTIGKHTLPEGLETGEYICQGSPYTTDYGNVNNCWLCLTMTNTVGNYLNGQYTGLSYLFFKDEAGLGKAFRALNDYIAVKVSNTEEIVSIFPLPKELVEDYVTFYPFGTAGWHYGIISTISTGAFSLGTISSSGQNALGNNYIPKNNKLLTYPYRYLYLTNNVGGSNIYKYEDFENENSFNIYGMLSISCSINAVPTNYKKVSENYNESLMGAKFPIASWTTDVYTNWLTQNGVNKDFANIVSESDIHIGRTLGMFNATGLDPSGVSSNVFGTMQEVYTHQKAPDSAKGNVNGGDIFYSLNLCNFSIYRYVIKEEYARIIDSYFDKYGYKVNEVKTPNIYTRRNWNYIKTIGCNFKGDIPQEDLQKIKNLFNRGITFWHNPIYFLNYSVNNDII